VVDQRRDLGYSFLRLSRAVAEAETPILTALGLDMWDYVVLSALESGPAQTQTQLAAKVQRDKTRLITTLDRLEALGHLQRRPAPSDRRNHVVELTPEGRELVMTCRARIRELEAELLAPFTASERKAFVTQLERLVQHTETPLL
jgi:DNA-binding MarR family transcriptional regulator